MATLKNNRSELTLNKVFFRSLDEVEYKPTELMLRKDFCTELNGSVTVDKVEDNRTELTLRKTSLRVMTKQKTTRVIKLLREES